MVVRSPKMFHYKTKKETGLLENYTSPPLKLKYKITSDQVAQKQWHDCVHTVTTGDAGEHNLVSFMSRPSSVQSVSSVAQLCLTLCDPMNRRMPGLLVHHQLPEFTQTHVH